MAGLESRLCDLSYESARPVHTIDRTDCDRPQLSAAALVSQHSENYVHRASFLNSSFKFFFPW